MSIAVVAYEMEGSKTGVGRYLEGFLQGLAENSLAPDGLPSDSRLRDWTLFFKGEPFEHPLWTSAYPGFTFRPIFDHRPNARPILWEQLRLPRLLRQHDFDLIYSPAYALPACHGLTMVTIHDLSFEHLPREFDFKERWRRRLLARQAARRADRILVPSGGIVQDIAQTYGVDSGRIAAVPLGLDRTFLSPASDGEEPDGEEPPDHSNLDAHGVRAPYLFFIGSMMPRRRLDHVLAAAAELAREEPELQIVLAGRNRLPDPSQLDRWIADNDLASRLVHLGYVPEALLPVLYRRAELTVYISTYEGYGLPPIESLACGTLAVASPGQALDDIWPDYPFRAPADDRAAVIQAAQDAWRARRDPKLLAAIEPHLAELTWRHCGARFLAEFERVLGS